jgi:DNA-binding MarR family transcriptional regulator
MRRKSLEIQAVIDNMKRVFQAINEYSKNGERSTGLTGTQLRAMKLLAESAPIRVSSLARRMFLHPATVVGILDRLEAKSLVTRTRSKVDRRAVDLELTVLGKDVVANAPEVKQATLVKRLEALSDEEFSLVAEGMEQVVHLLDAEHSIPQRSHTS